MDSTASADRRCVLAGLGAVAAAGLVGAPAAASGPATPIRAALLPWSNRGALPVSAGKISYAERGAGAPLVLLHKLGGWIADWRHLAPLIAGRRLIALDLPGHGESKMHGPAPSVVSVGEIAAMVLAALDQLEVDRFDLLGNSVGGVASILLAALHPDRVGKLVLISTMMSEPVTRAALAAREATGRHSVATRIRTRQEQAQRFGTLDPRISEEQAISNRIAGDWKSAAERGAVLFGSARYLPRITAPVMVISADRGPYLKYNDVAAGALRDVRIETISETGPFAHQEKPEEVARLINPFLAG